MSSPHSDEAYKIINKQQAEANMTNRNVLLVILVSVIANPAYGVTASVFTIDVPGGSEIDRQRDHMALILENGWISRENGFLADLFSKSKGGVFRISASTVFDNNQTTQLESTTLIEDPKGSMGRALGEKGPVYADIPADLKALELTVRLALTQEDRVKNLLGEIDNSKAALPAEVVTAPWVGYAKLVSTVTQSLFGTSDADYPLSGRYKLPMPTKEHYVLFIASDQENDKELSNAVNTDFEYKGQRLYFKNRPIQKWTHLVFKIARSDSKRSPEQRISDSVVSLDTPWATVVRTQLRVLRASSAKDSSQLSAIADNAYSALQNLEKFLRDDLSFSNFDRGSALVYYTNDAVKKIDEACKKKKYAECPTDSLVEYRDGIAKSMGIPDTRLAAGAKAIELQVAIESRIKTGEIKNPPGRPATVLPTLVDMEKYVLMNPAALHVQTNSIPDLQDAYHKVAKAIYTEKLGPQSRSKYSNVMFWDPSTKKVLTYDK